MSYRARKGHFDGDWIVEREIGCINGLAAWLQISTVYEASEAEMGYTDGAIGSAQERAEKIAVALNASG